MSCEAQWCRLPGYLRQVLQGCPLSTVGTLLGSFELRTSCSSPKLSLWARKWDVVAAVGAIVTSPSIMQVTHQWRLNILPQNLAHLWHVEKLKEIFGGWRSCCTPAGWAKGSVTTYGSPCTLHQHSNHSKGCFLFSLSKLHTDFSCHLNPEPHGKGDSTKYSSHLAEVPPLFIPYIVFAENIFNVLLGIYTPDYWCPSKRQKACGGSSYEHLTIS